MANGNGEMSGDVKISARALRTAITELVDLDPSAPTAGCDVQALLATLRDVERDAQRQGWVTFNPRVMGGWMGLTMQAADRLKDALGWDHPAVMALCALTLGDLD